MGYPEICREYLEQCWEYPEVGRGSHDMTLGSAKGAVAITSAAGGAGGGSKTHGSTWTNE